ncbi:MAG: NAD(P)/FAD-dependent oxidoreductase [Gammaproteobacteria bacterium]|nr:NAD(P)/FAD-dependent oxidoreductase [Gammaproteobacteria bacterium]
MDTFDVVVVGSGPGGYRAAVLAALRGKKTAIVERAVWGGCCLNRGCVPKKDWYHSARLLAHNDTFARRGLAGSLTGDLRQAWQHQHEMVDRVRSSYRDYLRRLGVTALSGHATLQDATTLAVDGHFVKAQSIILATGSRPTLPDHIAVVPDRIIHSDLLFDQPVPGGERVAVVGGGIIAVEFAYILRLFGKEVTWITRRDPFARRDFSPAAMDALRKGLTAAGVTPRLAAVRDATATGQGVTLHLDEGGAVAVDWVLMATGRRPVTDGLGLEAAGVTCDPAGFIAVDAHLQTAVPSIYAIGDCVSGPMTANRALFEAAVAVGNIIEPKRRTRTDHLVPEAVYSAVELARVGLTEEQAEDSGFEPATGFAAFEVSPKALGEDETDGFVRLVADMDSGRFLGGEVVGAEAGEMIHMLAALPAHDGLRTLSQTAFNHPSRSEEFQNAAETLAARWHLLGKVFG